MRGGGDGHKNHLSATTTNFNSVATDWLWLGDTRSSNCGSVIAFREQLFTIHLLSSYRLRYVSLECVNATYQLISMKYPALLPTRPLQAGLF